MNKKIKRTTRKIKRNITKMNSSATTGWNTSVTTLFGMLVPVLVVSALLPAMLQSISGIENINEGIYIDPSNTTYAKKEQKEFLKEILLGDNINGTK